MLVELELPVELVSVVLGEVQLVLVGVVVLIVTLLGPQVALVFVLFGASRVSLSVLVSGVGSVTREGGRKGGSVKLVNC